MSEVMLFKKCLGFTDSSAIATQTLDHKSGKTALTAVSNMTVTDDGAIQTMPPMVPVVTHTAQVARVSAGSRLFYGDGIDTYELTGSTSVKRFPLLDGPMIHTPLDVRVSGAAKVYKSINPAGAMTEAVVGTNPNPDDSISYAGQPLFDGGFVLGARLYANKGKYLQYSKEYGYDLWDLGNGFIGHQFDCLQSGAIPGCIVVAHVEGVSVYIGGDPLMPDTVKRFYPCAYLPGTLFSGYLSQALGHGHIFMATDGVYMVAADGSLNRLSNDNLEQADLLNSSYAGAVVAGGKYLAYGDSLAVEYDLRAKAVMLRASGVTSACVFHSTPYLAYGYTVSIPGLDSMAATDCSFTLPYSHLGAAGRKSFDSLYLTGEFNGDLEITLLDQQNPDEPERWTLPVPELGVVQNKRIRLPKGQVGSKVSFRFDMFGSSMRVEEIRCTFGAGKRR